MKIKAGMLNGKSFKPYGEIIGRPETKPEISNPEIDVWPDISNIGSFNGKGQFYWLDMKVSRPFFCDSLEKHKDSEEVLIPFEGQSIIIFGLSKGNICKSEDLDPDTVKAFIFDGSVGVKLNKGVWHWIPFPISKSTSFAIILKKDSHKNDLLIKDFKEAEGITFELEL
jgi:ureidoglycolate lyase